MNGWVSIDKSLPQVDGDYLVIVWEDGWHMPPTIKILTFATDLSRESPRWVGDEKYRRNGWYWIFEEGELVEETRVTHWMALPELPKTN